MVWHAAGVSVSKMTAPGILVLILAASACSEAPPGRAEAARGGGGAGGGASSVGAGAPEGEELSARLLRYVRGDTDRALRFEIDAVTGLAPYASSVEHVREEFSSLIEKPDGFVFDEDDSLAAFGADHEWTFEALDAFARQQADDGAGEPLTIHVLALDGRYISEDGSGTVLGLAWGERYIALFQDAIRAPCSGGGVGAPLSGGSCEIAERNVWTHEIGHILGLVDNGLPMRSAHRDAEHGRHDSSEGCVMYWAYEGPQLFDVLLSRLSAGQSPDLHFCERCRADIAAVQ